MLNNTQQELSVKGNIFSYLMYKYTRDVKLYHARTQYSGTHKAVENEEDR